MYVKEPKLNQNGMFPLYLYYYRKGNKLVMRIEEMEDNYKKQIKVYKITSIDIEGDEEIWTDKIDGGDEEMCGEDDTSPNVYTISTHKTDNLTNYFVNYNINQIEEQAWKQAYKKAL
jgi:hypothetical protein